MGATRLEGDGQQGGVPVRLQRVVVGDARPAVGTDGELEVVLGVAGDRRVDRPRVRVGVALDERVVRLVDRPVAERLLEHRVGVLGLGDRHEAARADVEALHDALALRRSGRGDAHARPGEVPDDGRPFPPDARVRGHADRLVDHDDVVVLEDDVHARHRLGHHGRDARRRDRRLQQHARLDPRGLLRHLAVELDQAVGQEVARPRAGQPQQAREGDVDAFPGESLRDRDDLALGGLAHRDSLVPSRA